MTEEYEPTISGMRKLMNDAYIEARSKYASVDVPSYIDFVIRKLEVMAEKNGEDNAVKKQEK